MRVRGCISLRWRRRQNLRDAAFSCTDLLALLALLALLTLLQFSALAHNKGNSHRAVCVDNMRRLALSWLMYADDNRGRLAPNLSAGTSNPINNWVGGWLDYTSPDSTNVAMITGAKLYPYDKSVDIYRCPDDLSAIRGQLRIRSCSMNGWVGEGTSAWTAGFQLMTDRSQIRQPDQAFVFIEEHPDSINDGLFVMDMSAGASLIDLPASYHYSGANLGFADGSVRYRQWLNVPATFGTFLPPVRGADVTWLQNISSYRK